MKPIGFAVLLTGLSLSMPVRAGTVYFDLANLPYPNSVISNTFTALPQTTFVNGDLEMTLTGQQRSEGSMGAASSAPIGYTNGLGVGVYNTGFLGIDTPSTDGANGDEQLTITFNRPVIFDTLVFADAFPQNNGQDQFVQDAFVLLNDGVFGDNNEPGKLIAFFNWSANGGTGNPNYQNLPNYVFKPNQRDPIQVVRLYVTSATTTIFLSSVTVLDVPEPSSVLLMLGAGLLAAFGHRRTKWSGLKAATSWQPGRQSPVQLMGRGRPDDPVRR